MTDHCISECSNTWMKCKHVSLLSLLRKPKSKVQLQRQKMGRLYRTRLKPATKHLRQRIFDQSTQIQSQRLPYQVIATLGKSKLRYYPAQQSSQDSPQQIPLIMIAPLAVKMSIYDLFPDRSLIGYLNQHGFDVYLMDWGSLDRQDRHLDFEYFIFTAIPKFIQAARQHSGCQEISIHGWSLGGIFSLLYAASGQDQQIRNLVIMGSPIDTHASGWIGQLFAKSYAMFEVDQQHKKNWLAHQMNLQWIHSPAWLNSMGYKLLNPMKTLNTHWQMLRHSHDLDVVSAHATLSDFLDDMVDYPGAIVRDLIFWVWLQNPLQHGQATYKNHHFDFQKIHSALLLVYGDNDDIVTEQALHPLLNTTSSTNIHLQSAPGGHLGMISGRQNAAVFWAELQTWLTQRSKMH